MNWTRPSTSSTAKSELPVSGGEIVPWRLAKLSPEQQRSAAAAFKIFKQNPFDPRLRPHKIHKLSAAYGKTVHAAVIEGDLRATFYVEGNTVWSVDIGTHTIYRQ